MHITLTTTHARTHARTHTQIHTLLHTLQHTHAHTHAHANMRVLTIMFISQLIHGSRRNGGATQWSLNNQCHGVESAVLLFQFVHQSIWWSVQDLFRVYLLTDCMFGSINWATKC